MAIGPDELGEDPLAFLAERRDATCYRQFRPHPHRVALAVRVHRALRSVASLR